MRLLSGQFHLRSLCCSTFVLALATNNVAQVNSSAPAANSQGIAARLVTLISDFGLDGELPGNVASPLGFTGDKTQPWPYMQISIREVEPDTSTPLHVYAVSRGSDPNVLLYVESAKSICMVRINRDGQAVRGFEIYKEEKGARQIPGAEAAAFLEAEFKFWNRKVDEAANWWACMGELAGARQVAPEKKIAACNWLIDSKKETPTGLALAYANRGMANRDNEQKNLDDLNMAVKVDPSCSYAWAMLCMELTRFGHDLDRALESCNKSVGLSPDSADGWTHRGDIYLKRAEFRKAIADFDQSLSLQPNWMWTHSSRGEAYARLGDLDDALSDFNEAIRLHPDFSVGHFERGVIRFLENDLDAAQGDFQDGFDVDPKCGSCLVGKGLVEIRKGDKSGGAADIAKGKSLTPTTAEDFDKYGISLPQL